MPRLAEMLYKYQGRNVQKHTTNKKPKNAWCEGSYSKWWQALKISKKKKFPQQR